MSDMNVAWVAAGVALLAAVLTFVAAMSGAKLTARVSLAQQRQDAAIERQGVKTKPTVDVRTSLRVNEPQMLLPETKQGSPRG